MAFPRIDAPKSASNQILARKHGDLREFQGGVYLLWLAWELGLPSEDQERFGEVLTARIDRWGCAEIVSGSLRMETSVCALFLSRQTRLSR